MSCSGLMERLSVQKSKGEKAGEEYTGMVYIQLPGSVVW